MLRIEALDGRPAPAVEPGALRDSPGSALNIRRRCPKASGRTGLERAQGRVEVEALLCLALA